MKPLFVSVLQLPADFDVVEDFTARRNQALVTVTRLQKAPPITPNNQHITLITDQAGDLVSFNSSAFAPGGQLPAENGLVTKAQRIFSQLLPDYAPGLSYMRAEEQTRSYHHEGTTITIPVYWVKFAHQNGSYNWATFGPADQLIEIERDALWDGAANRRATEMWNSDDWVQALKGQGPQLLPPNALAKRGERDE